MPRDYSFLEEAHDKVAGKSNNFRIQLNNVSVGDSNIIVERPAMSLERMLNRKNLDPSVLTPAYIKKPNKNRCALCKLWFEKSSVIYEVSNHRLVSLLKKWDRTKDGRRYECASYLYGFVTVCKFCSQLFDEDFKVSQPVEDLIITKKSKEEYIQTDISRMDITKSCFRMYMSSVVDNMNPERAVDDKFPTGSKSRREVDPWWEVDLMSTHHIHSISFTISGGLHIHIPVYVLLLKKPTGFENPFIDQIIPQAVASTEYFLPESTQILTQTFDWKLPPKSYGRAIRIQLKSLHTLHVMDVKIMQGDEYLASNAEDVQLLKESYAAAPLELLKSAHRDYEKEFHQQVRPKTTTAGDISQLNRFRKRENNILALTNTMKTRYVEIDQWKDQIDAAAKYFTMSELWYLRELIFLESSYKDDTTSAPPRSQDEFMHESKISPPPSRGTPSGDFSVYTMLTSPNPRSDLMEIYKKVRQIVLWIQTKQNTKKLGSLAKCEGLKAVANDSEIALHHLKKSLEYIEANKVSSSAASNEIDNELSTRGCTWGQFCYIMQLFCTNRAYHIPRLVFRITKDESIQSSFASEELLDESGVGGGGGRLRSDSRHRSSRGSDGKPADFFNLDQGSFTENSFGFDNFFNEASRTAPAKLGRQEKIDMSPITTSLRKKGIPPMVDSSFYRFKLDRFQRKQAKIDVLEFPKQLTADFTKMVLDLNASSSYKLLDKPVRKEDPIESMFEFNDEISQTSGSTKFSTETHKRINSNLVVKSPQKSGFNPTKAMAEIIEGNVKLSSVSSDNNLNGGNGVSSGAAAGYLGLTSSASFDSLSSSKKKKNQPFFKRICALCNLQFPKHAVTSFVLYKHVIRLRRHWDPSLVSDKVQMLEQNMSMYNLVPACVFCAQFFDPDFPGGIAIPNKGPPTPKPKFFEKKYSW